MTWPSHDLTPQQTSRHQNTSLQSTKHHHHGTAEGSFTAKEWFGHRAGRSPCAHSIGKFFLCYIVLFLLETSAPGLSGHYWYIYLYHTHTMQIYVYIHVFCSFLTCWTCRRAEWTQKPMGHLMPPCLMCHLQLSVRTLAWKIYKFKCNWDLRPWGNKQFFCCWKLAGRAGNGWNQTWEYRVLWAHLKMMSRYAHFFPYTDVKRGI